MRVDVNLKSVTMEVDTSQYGMPTRESEMEFNNWILQADFEAFSLVSLSPAPMAGVVKITLSYRDPIEGISPELQKLYRVIRNHAESILKTVY